MDARKQFSRVGWCYVGFLLVYVLLSCAVSVLFFFSFFWFDMNWYNENVLMLFSDLILYGVAFPFFYVLMRRIPAWKKETPEPISPGRFGCLLLVCVGMTYLGNFIGLGLMSQLGEMTGEEMRNPVLETVENMDVWAVFVTTVLIAPMMEELMFRKMLIDRLIPFGQKTAVILSGISFGLFHGNFYQFFYAAALGMMFAYVYSSTGMLRYPVLLHMGINFIGGVLPMLLETGLRTGNPVAVCGDACLGALMVISIGAAAVWIAVRLRTLRWTPAWECSGNGIVVSILTAPGIWGFLVISGILFVMNG